VVGYVNVILTTLNCALVKLNVCRRDVGLSAAPVSAVYVICTNMDNMDILN
jgi:hypothetical protein